jgi:hypothetical protein
MMNSAKPQWGQRLTGLKPLIAPLLGLSLGLHGLLLLAPLPDSTPEPEVEEVTPEEEEFVDLLSISRLATPPPEAEPPPAEPPPAAVAPPSSPPPPSPRRP